MPGKFESLRGQLLLDSGQLRGSFFDRSVVLICHHDADGAFGLVLNRPAEMKVGDVLVEDVGDAIKQGTLFLGGPVQTTALTYLHSDSFLADANVMPNLNMGHSLDDLIEIGEGISPTRQVRCFAGYAGWTAGQLEGEMKRKSWLTHSATLELVFTSDPGSLWKMILNEKGWQYRLIADAPEDLSYN